MDTLTQTRRELDALRTKHGARSPVGSRCSMLSEMAANYQEAEDPEQRRRLGFDSQKVTAGLARALNQTAGE
jgi:hypothetical protein